MTKDTEEFSQFTDSVACREYTLPRDESLSEPKGWIRGNTKIGPVSEVATSFLHGKYGVEIRISSRICHGLNKFVMNLNNNDTEVPEDQPEEQALQLNVKDFACRSRAKAKPQKRETSELPSTIPTNERKCIDIEPAKRSHGVNVHNLIQRIENHPQRQAFQSDLQQHRPFNPFSRETKDAIKAAGNTELCEIIDVEPKAQCRACLTYWDVGIVFCTCGHLMKDDTTENKKYISSVLDLLSIPNFYIRKGRPHGHKYGKKEGCKEYHTANQLQKKCRKKEYKNIQDRFIRDLWFRKTMIELVALKK